MIHIKDLSTGKVRLYGTDVHDSLTICEDGKFLYYENLQNGDGSRDGYRFVTDEKGFTPDEDPDCYEYGWPTVNIGGFRTTEEAEEMRKELKKLKEMYFENVSALERQKKALKMLEDKMNALEFVDEDATYYDESEVWDIILEAKRYAKGGKA